MNKKVALISGVTGQDGSYLAEYLLVKGYRVIGLKRRSSLVDTPRINHLFKNENFEVKYYNLGDSSIYRLLTEYQPDEFYNLAAQSHVKVSFENPEYTVDTIVKGTLMILEAIRTIAPECKFYQAGSSEMFGNNPEKPLNEKSVFMPDSPYACAKVCAHHLVRNYRESYNIKACNGVLFNHESARRGENFVTRKITRAAAKIKLGLQDKLRLGNLNARRDWGFAPDYTRAMHLMLQSDQPDDYVVATGEAHTVKEFVECTFALAGLDVDEYVEIDERLFRPTDVECLLGDPSKIKDQIGWEPLTSFKMLIKIMYVADLREITENMHYYRSRGI